MKRLSKKERGKIYYEALCDFELGNYNFICNSLKRHSERRATEDEFPEFFLFKETNHIAWLSNQIDPSCEMSLNEVSQVKVIVLGLCIAMCD
jgi:hypothetical protein